MAQEKNIVNNIYKNEFIFEGIFNLVSVTHQESKDKNGNPIKWDDLKISNGEDSITLSAPYDSGADKLQMHAQYKIVINADKFRKAKIVGIYEIPRKE